LVIDGRCPSCDAAVVWMRTPKGTVRALSYFDDRLVDHGHFCPFVHAMHHKYRRIDGSRSQLAS
jgi:hypothetical protein